MDDDDKKLPNEQENTERTDEARKIVEEYAESQRQIAESLRKKMN